jgi:predicted HD phosphohydrolase
MVATYVEGKFTRMNCTPESIVNLYQSGGARIHAGDSVSHLEHAWQCGRLAEKSGASLPLQLASWLHDIGHLWVNGEGSPTLRGEDDLHEDVGASLLLPVFGESVSEPVRWHVQAKRYLVTTRPGYAKKLSPDSLRSLQLQGGVMSPADGQAFEKNPYFVDALKLRVWDDLGKNASWFDVSQDEALAHLSALMKAVAARRVTKI